LVLLVLLFGQKRPQKGTCLFLGGLARLQYRVDSNLTMVELQPFITRQNRVQLRRPTDDLSRLASINGVLKSHLISWSESLTLTRQLKCDVIVKLKYWVEDKDEHKTYFWEQKTKFHEVYVKYDHLVDSIRLDPAEILMLVGRTPPAVSAWVERPAPVFSCL
jgi:hypothetical protein